MYVYSDKRRAACEAQLYSHMVAVAAHVLYHYTVQCYKHGAALAVTLVRCYVKRTSECSGSVCGWRDDTVEVLIFEEMLLGFTKAGAP